MNYKSILLFTLIIGLLCPMVMSAESRHKEKLKILYVGGTTEFNEMNSDFTPQQIEESVKARMASFEKYLNEYFTTVKVINAKDYVQSMSDNYDVTIMDGVPKALKPRVYDGKSGIFKKAEYFTEDFSRPILTIGHMGEELGRSVGTKHDWYCLCLMSHAHSWRANHPIFNGPFKVKIDQEQRATPQGIYSFPHYFKDNKVPATMTMWRVQKYDFNEKTPNVRIGMVSRPGGYEDSPEAEYISGGECLKSPDAVAIGRHGNWFHWGFAASPDNLTDQAKPVLANAIVYISQFAGQTPIARKYNDRIITRDRAKDIKQFISKESYNQNVKSLMEFNEARKATQAELRKKEASGVQLSANEKQSLSFGLEPIPSYDEFLQQMAPALYKKYGSDINRYIEYYDDNYDYFCCDGKSYDLIVDETAKALGIANNNKEILNASIKILEGAEDASKKIDKEGAKKILNRYTLVNFDTPAQWREWYEKNNSKLFFSESAGWIYLINSREKGVNNYNIKEERVATDALKAGGTDNNNPVSIALGTKYMHDGSWLLTVKFSIHKGYHIYATTGSSDPFIATKVDVKLPESCTAIGSMKYPSPEYFNQNGTTVFHNSAVYQLRLDGRPGDKLEVNIEYQCCDISICFPPVKNSYSVELKNN